MKGRFITLEGGEGCGKSTNLAFIAQFLQDKAIEVVVTREPGGTKLAEEIRALLLNKDQESVSEQTELLMMFAARAQHIKHVILPALKQGQWVLCDRFTDSSYAYQGGGRNMDTVEIEWLENFVQRELRPDLTLLLDAPVEVGMARAVKRGNLDRFEREAVDFFNQVRDVFLARAEQYPERIKVIDAAQSLSSVQTDISVYLQSLIDE